MNKRQITILILFILVFLPTAAKTSALISKKNIASLKMAPDYENFLSDNLSVDIIASSSQPINAVDINISFPADKLSALNIDYTNSFCNFFITDNIDNQNGNIKISCGAPNKNSNKQQYKIAQLKFKKLQTAWAKLNFFDSSLLISDGIGTNILTMYETHNIYLQN